MVKRVLLPAVVLTLCIGALRSAAGEFPLQWLHVIKVPDCIRKRCCDDYCPKPLPCPANVALTGCDDYCPKPLTCARDIQRFCCDDFCPKPVPCVVCPPCTDLKCSPWDGSRQSDAEPATSTTAR